MSSAKRFKAVPLAEFRLERTEWLMPGRIPAAALTIVGGDPGLGKSQFTCLLAAQLSRGHFGDPGATLFIAGEDDPAIIRARVTAVGGDAALVRIVQSDTAGGFLLPDDVVELERLVAEHEVRCVVIDPVTAHLSSTVNSHRDAEVRSALQPLSDLAAKHRCAVVAVMHLNKSGNSPSLYRLSGSVAFSGAPRSVLLFARDPDDPAGDAGNRRALAHNKCNLAPLAPTLIYEIRAITLPARDDDDEVTTSRLELVGRSTKGASDLLAFADSEARSALEEAEEFLRDFLAGEPKEKGEVTKAALREGIALKTLRRARERLGVFVTKSGFPARSYWSLSGAQPLWAPQGNGDLGHDWTNPHGSAENVPSREADDASRAHSPGMGTTGTEAELEKLIEQTFDAREITA